MAGHTPRADAAKQQTGSDELQRLNVDVEGRAQSGAADERLRSIIDSAVDGIIVIDQRGHIESFNPAAERLFGYPRSEVVGRNVNILMPSPYHEEHDGYLSRYLTTGEAKIIGIGREVAGRRRDGTGFPLHLSVGQMTIGGERKFTGILHDLSDRVALEHRLRASEARWRSIIQSAVDGIVVIDAHGRVEAFNPAAERLFGYSEEEVLGQNVNVLMPFAISRGARHLSGPISVHRPSQNHWDRSGSHRPTAGWHEVPTAPVRRPALG
jgi:PAS domain S-box-containing protein